ncbi:MAG: hypothetical protein KBE04_08045 [Phycisphaerae bacterium]|nr:hypothetical protein [Phycisphaerae bacterium]
MSVITLAVLGGGAGCTQRTPEQGPSSTHAVDKAYERGPLTVHVRLDRDKISIAETLRLEIEARIRSGYELTMPKIDKVLEDFGLADWDSEPDRLGDEDRIVRTRRYRLEPFVSGPYQIPSLTFQFLDAKDPNKTYTLETEPVDVEVTSLLGEDRAKLTIADIEDVVDPPRPRSWAWLWLPGVLGAAGLAIWAWAWVRRRRAARQSRILRPAHEVAYDRLRALVEARLVEAGRVKEFYEAITAILRHYIEDRFSLRAPEQTTEEFLTSLAQTDALPPSDKADLGAFLGHCDLVKFARHQPTREQVQGTFDRVRDFIEKTRSDEHLLDVTDPMQVHPAAEGATP